MAALTSEQQQFVSEEIDRRITAQASVTSSNLQVLMDETKNQFRLETQSLTTKMVEFEQRLTEGIVGQIDGRLEFITNAFQSEMTSLKGIMQAIGGEKFEEVSKKLAFLDDSNKHHIQLLSEMMRGEATILRTAHDNLKTEQVRHAQEIGVQQAAVADVINRVRIVEQGASMAMGPGLSLIHI